MHNESRLVEMPKCWPPLLLRICDLSLGRGGKPCRSSQSVPHPFEHLDFQWTALHQVLSGSDPAETEKIWILDSKHWNSSLATGSGRAEKNDDIASPEEPPLLLTGKKSVWWGEGLGGTTVYTVLPKYMTLPLRARNRGIEHQNKQILYRHSWCSTLKKNAFVVVNIWILLCEATLRLPWIQVF